VGRGGEGREGRGGEGRREGVGRPPNVRDALTPLVKTIACRESPRFGCA